MSGGSVINAPNSAAAAAAAAAARAAGLGSMSPAPQQMSRPRKILLSFFFAW